MTLGCGSYQTTEGDYASSWPFHQSIVNSSLTSCSIPICFKTALVKPLLNSPKKKKKKNNLDVSTMNNYRPVSKLSFLSKVPEKTVFIQFFTIHLTDKNLFEKFQSAFRFLHSTETALLKVCNNLLLAEDSEFSILVILNLSVVFNPVYHNKQEWWAGLTEVALTCLGPSYLTDVSL